jgi:hypothetical protein
VWFPIPIPRKLTKGPLQVTLNYIREIIELSLGNRSGSLLRLVPYQHVTWSAKAERGVFWQY